MNVHHIARQMILPANLKSYLRCLRSFLANAGTIACMTVVPVFVHAAGDPFEPEVSSADRRLLQEAIDVGQTNAIAAARMLATGDRRGAAVAFTAGNFYFQAESYTEAATAYEEAIEKFPRFRSARANLGRVYLLQDEPAKTIQLYQSLVADGQADADVYLLLGHALQMQSRPVSAETAFRQALLLNPEKAEAMKGLIQTLLEQERYQEALALTGEVLALQPDNRELWRLRANAMMLLSRYSQAIQTIETAKRLHLVDAELLSLQGDLFLHAGQPADALSAYMDAFGQAPPSPEQALRAMEGFLMLEDAAGMQQLLSVLETEDWLAEHQSALLRMRAQNALQTENLEEAASLSEKAVALNPLDGRALFLLADLAEQAGELERAVLYCERAARISGYEVDAWVRQAQIEVRRNRLERAIPLLESAQAREDQPHVARYLEQLRRMQR